MEELMVYEFRPLFLTMDRIGPFRNSYQIDFTAQDDRPCNFYMMVSRNGLGKTTALEIFACLVDLLGKKDISVFGHEDLDMKGGRAQLDFWLRLRWQGRNRAVVLSIVAGKLGEEVFLLPWTEAQLQQYNAESWHRTGFRSPVAGRYETISSRNDELLQDFLAAIRASAELAPDAVFLQPRLHLPTVLYFSAYRDIPPINEHAGGSAHHNGAYYERSISQPQHWNYRSLHAFAPHNTLWRDSLDNLAVWLKWLDNGSFETAQRLIDEQVFDGTPKRLKGIRKVPPEAMVDAGDGETHRLDRLSSGEKSLVHLLLRIGAHATANTVIMLDELDAHLHIAWQHRLYNLLEKLVVDHPGFTVIMTTHSKDILRRFTAAMNIEKTGIVPGGDLIDRELT
ncbi:MAG: ATP-binding protein [Methylococcaceae bacterium]|nr:MAG: ATP-binding protein [Methylococcaceae bacterium]